GSASGWTPTGTGIPTSGGCQPGALAWEAYKLPSPFGRGVGGEGAPVGSATWTGGAGSVIWAPVGFARVRFLLANRPAFSPRGKEAVGLTTAPP
ncbi:MAG TPA: hypothetical protein PLD05_10975, partial [Thermogutta sp.]|nr:hypothetical protein [Thermogutta sp.]